MTEIFDSWQTTHGDTVELYVSDVFKRREDPEPTTQFRYRVQARNGEIVETGSQAYTRKESVREAALRHHPVAASIVVINETAKLCFYDNFPCGKQR